MLSATLSAKLDRLIDRQNELSSLLSDPEVVADRNRYTALMKEFAEREPVLAAYSVLNKATSALAESESLLEDDDPEMRELAQEEVGELQAEAKQAERELKRLLLPKDPDDALDVFLEIRAGTGGDEAALFAGDLFRMYGRYSEDRGWQLTKLAERSSEHGGYKEVVARIGGKDVYERLKFESGAHRVQRVPETESQGRIHTSACTVAVLPEQKQIDAVDIDTKDVRVDTYRASGAGGQHVNKTDSAVRLTHLPSGIVVECQDERSQHQNKIRAMSLLNAKLLDQARAEQRNEREQTRRNLVGTGDRSERIRTYNFPQRRVTDHRIGLVLYKLEEVLNGNLDAFISRLTEEHQADLLASMGEGE